MDKKRDAPQKEKRRNNEKRKEKSRDAARSRRSRETEIFTDLASTLPITPEQNSQLDKASIMRLAISYLRVRDMVSLVPVSKMMAKDDKGVNGLSFLNSFEGFILALSPEGDFVYLSENVNEYLGITHIDLMGQNVFEYSHPCDHEELKEVICGKSCENFDSPKSIFVRLKCTLTSKGRSVNLKSATYKVIHCTGHLVKSATEVKKESVDKGTMHACFIAVGQPIPHPSNIETPLPKQTFLTKHGLDMKFTHADDEFMTNILGYEPEDLLGKSVYEYHHAMDSDAILSAYKCLFSKGQCETNRYRFLAKTGGYVWVVTQATLIHDKMQKPQSVVCVNYALSGLECKDEIYSASQYSCVKSEAAVATPSVEQEENNNNVHCRSSNDSTNDNDVKATVVEQNSGGSGGVGAGAGGVVDALRRQFTSTAKLFGDVLVGRESSPAEGGGNVASRPQTATSKIFGPRTKDMSKGFLMFSEDTPGRTMLKDEPDDLTHLAPVAGDVCVPLDDNSLFGDVLDDILLRGDNLAPLLLADEPSTTDPFISYRDFQDPSPQLLSPNLSKHSDCSLPSLNSPSDSLTEDDQMSSFMNLHMDDDPDLLLKAPYIPMNVTDDLPLLMSNDLMWNSNEKKPQLPESNSSLAQLLSTSLGKQKGGNGDRGGGGGGLLHDQNFNDVYNNEKSKDSRKPWNSHTTRTTTQSVTNSNNSKNSHLSNNKLERSTSIKRSNPSAYDHSNKKIKNEPPEKMSSELLHQLISTNHNRGRPKGKSNWLLDSGGQKAACISQPSDSVLMNLLENVFPVERKAHELSRKRQQFRKNSISLLDPEATSIASLMDLTQQDYEVNAPVSNNLLQGEELLSALEVNPASI